MGRERVKRERGERTERHLDTLVSVEVDGGELVVLDLLERDCTRINRE